VEIGFELKPELSILRAASALQFVRYKIDLAII